MRPPLGRVTCLACLSVCPSVCRYRMGS